MMEVSYTLQWEDGIGTCTCTCICICTGTDTSTGASTEVERRTHVLPRTSVSVS